MKVFTTWFGTTYRRFASVLGKSVRAHTPTARFESLEMRPARALPHIPRHATTNTAKLEVWNEAAQDCDEHLVLMDADTLCLGDLSEAFEQEFDLAYTVRPGLRRIQAGVVYMRPTAAAKAFLMEWTILNDTLLDDPERLAQLIAQYGGANQAALSLLVADPTVPVKLATLPCERWNCCAQTWGTYGPDTRVLHLTGRLRRAAMEGRVPAGPPYLEYRDMVADWIMCDRMQRRT